MAAIRLPHFNGLSAHQESGEEDIEGAFSLRVGEMSQLVDTVLASQQDASVMGGHDGSHVELNAL